MSLDPMVQKATTPKVWDLTRDYHSFANTDQVQVTHLSLALIVDFDQQRLFGKAMLSLHYLQEYVSELWLDTRDLLLLSVTTLVGESLAFSFQETCATLGQIGRQFA